MYTSYNADSKPTPSVAEPSAPASATPRSPALSMHQISSTDALPHRMAPTSSPSVTPAQSNVTSPPMGGPPGQAFIDGMKDLHLSGSEPRIYPGMISRRQRANSLRQSMHESDLTAGLTGASQSIDEAVETEETQ